jgi:hypothetical protein
MIPPADDCGYDRFDGHRSETSAGCFASRCAGAEMPRIPIVHEDDPATEPEARALLMRVKDGLGEVFDSVRLMANHPRQATALVAFARSVRRQNNLTPALTELAYTTGSVTNGCHY